MLHSTSVVVALYVGQMDLKTGKAHLDYESRDDVTHLMDRRWLPNNEPVWTCRVWAKRVLNVAYQYHYIQLPTTAKIDNTFEWLNNVNKISFSGRSKGTVPMDIDSSGGRYLGPKPMQGVQYQVDKCQKCGKQFECLT